MQRREFLASLTAVSGVVATDSAAARLQEATARSITTASGQIDELLFGSSASLLDASGGELTDPAVAAVWLESTASNTDADGNGDATLYGDGTDVPVVAVDGGVVGIGSTLVEDGTNWQPGNEQFLLNVWDAKLGGSGTVLWDGGHGQYYDLTQFTEFEGYAENNGYTVQATTSLASDLSGADAAVITSPSTAFSGNDLQALADFVATGGVVFLHDQSDYSDYDETANLNAIASDLGLAFRFNDDQVVDPEYNLGATYQPLTTNFNTNFDYFADREGLELDPSKTYTVDVTSVSDGDTVTVTFDDGSTESIRVLGVDTPEKSANSQYERIQEWEGIESSTYLENWADSATTFAKDEIGGKTVDLHFDSNEPVRDGFGRVLGYLTYDATGDGSRNTLFNYQLIAEGYARIYGSSLSKHEQFWDGEADARANSRRVWTDSDPNNSTEIRDRAVDDLFFPTTSSVRTSAGALDTSRAPVVAESSASQQLDGGVDYAGAVPLVGIDDANNVAVVGSPFVDESYESGEGYAVDTSTYENFAFLTNLLDSLSSTTGDVLVDGGHGQFAADYALSSEDAAYYQRYLEGQDVGFEQVNAITADNLSRGRTLLVTTPVSAYTTSEVDAVTTFLSNGGSVVLLGAGTAPSTSRQHLNDLAAQLGTDLRVNEDQVVDSTNNVNADSDVPTTTVFDTSFDLFDAFTTGSGGDTSVGVSTGTVSNVTDTSATLSGSLDDLGGATDADVGFEYRQSGASTWTATATQTLSATGSYSTDLSGLSASTDYEFRAVATASDGDTDTGTTAAFTTTTGASVDLGVATTHPDAAGTDGNNLNDEYVVIENVGSSNVDCTGFTVQDEAGKTYTFPDAFTLDAGATVTLHTGSGTDTATDLYWGYGSAVWNNSGDTVFVYDDAGTQLVNYTYSDANPTVFTDGATAGDTAATLSGTLDDDGSASSTDVGFEYRESGTNSWTATATQTLSSAGSYTTDVSGLTTGTDYEFRAVADASDGQSDDGTVATFTTGSGDTAPAVSTGTAADVSTSEATLSGSLDDLGGASSADAGFEYRQSGASTWTATATRTLSATGSYSEVVSGLASGTDYEFRAVATASDGDTATGTTAAFSTDSDTGDSAPVVDTLSVRNRSNGGWARFSVDWAVSDADGDLASVSLELGQDGVVVDSASPSVSGGSASGNQRLQDKKGSGSYTVTVTVTDSAGNTDSASTTLTV